MNIQGDTIPRPIQVSTQPTQFILVPRFNVAGDNSLYSFLLSWQHFHSEASTTHGNINKKAPKIIAAAIGPTIKAVPQELYAYAAAF